MEIPLADTSENKIAESCSIELVISKECSEKDVVPPIFIQSPHMRILFLSSQCLLGNPKATRNCCLTCS